MEGPIRKTSQFYSDLTEIVDHIAPNSPTAALRFLDSVEETIEMLRRMPELGTKFGGKDVRFQDLRYITIRDFRSYVLIYDVRRDELLFLRIVHGSRDLSQLC